MIAASVLAVAALVANTAIDPHPYRAYWPARAPIGMVVFLHGVSLNPMEEEGEGVDLLVKRAHERGLIAIVPLGHRVCDFTPTDVEHCWDLDRVDEEVHEVRRIMSEVQLHVGKSLRERELIGFSNGGFLVAGALQRGLLAGFTRVGIIAAGKVGDALPALTDDTPDVYIAVGKADQWQRSSTLELVAMLKKTALEARVRFLEVPGGHVFDGDRAAQFLEWFWSDAG